MFHAFTFVFLRSRLFLCQRTKAPVLLYYYDNGEKICRMFFIRRLPRKRQTVLILESIVRHYVSVSKSRFAIFKQYNVNNVKLNIQISTQLREKFSTHTHTHTPGAVGTHTHTLLEQWAHTHTHTWSSGNTHTHGAVGTHTHTHTHTWSSGHTHTWSSGHTHTHTHHTHTNTHLEQWATHTHLEKWKHTHTTHTHHTHHLEQWAVNAAAPGGQLGVRCLAQGSHLSRGQFLLEPRTHNLRLQVQRSIHQATAAPRL